jgi:hypothetical protein
MVVATLVDAAPGQVRGRWSPLRPTWAAVVARPTARAARAAESTGPTRSAVVIGSAGSTWTAVIRPAGAALLLGRRTTGSAGSTLPAWAALPTRSAWAALVLTLRPPGSTRAALSAPRALARAALRPARRGPWLGGRETDTGRQCGYTDADGDGGRTRRAFEMHGIFPFEASFFEGSTPTAARYGGNLCASYLLHVSEVRDGGNPSDGRGSNVTRHTAADTPDTP